jgi:simple sugar transport system substrate-binding protein
LQVAEKSGVFGFGQASDQIKFAPKAQLTATIDDWGPYYIDRVQATIDGTWKTGDYFGGMIDDDAVGMAPFTNMPADVAAFAGKIKEGIKNGKYHAFTGPIKDNTGKLQLKDGEIADDKHLNTMMYYVEGINAKVPGS